MSFYIVNATNLSHYSDYLLYLMKILFDHQVFSLEVIGGMSKYYTELMTHLVQEGHEVIVPVWRTHNHYLLQTLKTGINIL